MYITDNLNFDDAEYRYEVTVTQMLSSSVVAHFPNVVAGRYYVLLDIAHYGFATIPNHDD
jgi:hypothetical protein